MKALLVRGGRVVDPANKRDEVCDVLVEKGKVARVAKSIKAPAGCKELDAKGRIVAPGFLDMHTHLREPGFEYKETIETGSRAAAEGGFASVACMANTEPPNDNQNVTRFIRERAAEAGLVNVFPVGAVSKGLRGEELAEFGDMAGEGIVAVSDDGNPVADAELMRRALEYAKLFDFPVINHAEEPSLSGDGVIHEGEISTLLGLRGIPGAAEDAMVARDVYLAELTGSRLHVPHLSTREAVRIVREAKARGARVSCEVAPHHLVLGDEACKTFDTNTKMKPPLRPKADVEALREALADGTVDAVATDHAPHHWDEKSLEFPLAPFGVVGLETAVSLMADRFVHAGLLTWTRLVELFSENPARILNLRSKGHLSPGADADVTVIIVSGRVVYERPS
jgi:dihydroorotase